MIGDRIKDLRKDRRFTQKMLADKVSVSPQVISNWERGYTEPSADDVNRLSEVLRCSSDYLLGKNTLRATMSMFIPIEDGYKKLQEKQKSIGLTEEEQKLLSRIKFVLEDENGMIIDEIEDIKEELLELDRVVLNKDERDIAKRLKQFEADLENSDGLAFDGEPMSDEAKESLLESMELLFRQTQRINKKFTPKKYREDE